jgi:hypothetical protein
MKLSAYSIFLTVVLGIMLITAPNGAVAQAQAEGMFGIDLPRFAKDLAIDALINHGPQSIWGISTEECKVLFKQLAQLNTEQRKTDSSLGILTVDGDIDEYTYYEPSLRLVREKGGVSCVVASVSLGTDFVIDPRERNHRFNIEFSEPQDFVVRMLAIGMATGPIAETWTRAVKTHAEALAWLTRILQQNKKDRAADASIAELVLTADGNEITLARVTSNGPECVAVWAHEFVPSKTLKRKIDVGAWLLEMSVPSIDPFTMESVVF